MSQYRDYIVMYTVCMHCCLHCWKQTAAGKTCMIKCIVNLQALGTRCMSAEATERPKFDEILRLVNKLDVDQ